MSSIRPTTPPVRNVLLGWFGFAVPPPPRHRNGSRAAYRKTPRKRSPRKLPAQASWEKAA